MGDIVFVDGLRAYVPNLKAPPHIKARLSINIAQLIDWLRAQTPDENGEVRAELCMSKGGKYYCRLDTYRPASRDGGGAGGARVESPPAKEQARSDEIPF